MLGEAQATHLMNRRAAPLNDGADAIGLQMPAQAVAIAAGGYHTCALIYRGPIKCWGQNDSGQLGNSSTTDSQTPVDVTGISTAVAVAAGQDFTCAVLSDGAVKCWGNNAYGQLGNGSTTSGAAAVTVTGLAGVVAVAAGGSHSCALLSNGSVK